MHLVFTRLFLAAELLLLTSTAGLLRGQSLPNPPRLEFEVASVKASASGLNGVRGGCHGIDSRYSPNETGSAPPLGRCVITDGRLSHLIAIAYSLRSIGLIKSAPDWVIADDERFTVEAKAEDPTKTTEEQLLSMLQALLEERFQLKFHRENIDVAGFGLVVAKNGSKLREAAADEVVTSFGPAKKPRPGQPINLTARKYSMTMLADLLSDIGPGPVRDQTGLNGVYDIQLQWDETAGPSLFTALQEQLGLRLEPQKVPQSFFVFDSAQRPGAN